MRPRRRLTVADSAHLLFLTMSDEVSDFLRSVEQLNHRRDEDDEARAREREEKILQQRRERQARREGTYFVLLHWPLGRP